MRAAAALFPGARATVLTIHEPVVGRGDGVPGRRCPDVPRAGRAERRRARTRARRRGEGGRRGGRAARGGGRASRPSRRSRRASASRGNRSSPPRPSAGPTWWSAGPVDAAQWLARCSARPPRACCIMRPSRAHRAGGGGNARWPGADRLRRVVGRTRGDRGGGAAAAGAARARGPRLGVALPALGGGPRGERLSARRGPRGHRRPRDVCCARALRGRSRKGWSWHEPPGSTRPAKPSSRGPPPGGYWRRRRRPATPRSSSPARRDTGPSPRSFSARSPPGSCITRSGPTLDRPRASSVVSWRPPSVARLAAIVAGVAQRAGVGAGFRVAARPQQGRDDRDGKHEDDHEQ